MNWPHTVEVYDSGPKQRKLVNMVIAEVERIVRSVLTEYAVPMTLRNVTTRGDVWEVTLAPRTRAPTVRLLIHDGTAHSVRRSLIAALSSND